MQNLRYFLTVIAGVFSAVALAVIFPSLIPVHAPTEVLGAPETQATFQKNLIPMTDSTYTLGTTTKTWLNLYTDEICLAGDCQTAWPAGGPGSGDGVSNWLFDGTRLTPSTTVGIGVFASSTIGDGTATGGLTIRGGATTTNESGDASVRTLAMIGDSPTPASGDSIYQSYFVTNDAGVPNEIVRVTQTLTNEVAGTETGQITFAIKNGGGFVDSLLISDASLRPVTNNDVSLGASSVAWSDLFLASTAVLGFGNGDVTLTHATNKLTLDGASLGYIFSGGNVGIGSTSPSRSLTVAGDILGVGITATGTLTVTPLTSALTLTGADGAFAEYAGTSCTNQMVTGLSALGVATCETIDLTDTNITAGDALTITANDIDFDGGATPSGDLGGTWASPSVSDDSHNHTGTTLSGIDISADTNLSADGTEIVLTGDALSLGTELTFTNATSSTSFFSALGTFTNSVISTLLTALNVTVTGLLDVGGGSLEVPNGTAPTVDAVGEIALDTSDNQFIVGTTTNAVAVVRTKDEIYKFSVPSTSPAFATGTVKYLPRISDGYIIDEVWCGVEGGTSKIINILGTNLTCTTGAGATAMPSITSIASGSSTVGYTASTTSGIVNYLNVTITGRWIRE